MILSHVSRLLCPTQPMLPSKELIRLLVADAYPVVREGLKHMLSDAPAIEVVGGATTVAALRKALRETACDVLVVGLTPLSTGTWWQRERRRFRCG